MVSPGRAMLDSTEAIREEARAPEVVVKNSTDSEHNKIRLMRALVETQDPSAKVRVPHLPLPLV